MLIEDLIYFRPTELLIISYYLSDFFLLKISKIAMVVDNTFTR